ncbi:MAG: hypothetical protein EOO85_29645, partial [Pedobacter sp.]
MRISRNLALENTLRARLSTYVITNPLLGIVNPNRLDAFIKQLVDSIRRIEYVTIVRNKVNSPTCVDPNIIGFNPIKAAAFHHAAGNHEEACWLVFLLTHFGKNKTSGWRLITEAYSMGGTGIADWNQVQNNPQILGQWIANNEHIIKANGGNFGNHRKYQSLEMIHTGRTISSYVNWIGPAGSHAVKFAQLEPAITNPQTRFRAFSKSMKAVHGFGRTGIFDYLTMIGKLGLADIEPDSVYMQGATGPFIGGQLLFTNSTAQTISRPHLDQRLLHLNNHLNIPFGMQVLEDAIC